MDNLNVLPDFGYNGLLLDDDFKGWGHFIDLIQGGSKYERVNNYVEAQKLYQISQEKK
jgi:hypothetical protein